MSKPPAPLIARLADRSVRAESGCVLFTGHRMKSGYATFYNHTAGAKQLVHRIAYELYVGPIPEGLQVDHRCGVRHCINPEHLEAVTPLVNTRRAARGNAVKTACIHGHPFTPENTRVHQRPNGGALTRICRRCDADRQAQYRERDPDKATRLQRESAARNRDATNARRRARHAEQRRAA